jgi:hypothetical protein
MLGLSDLEDESTRGNFSLLQQFANLVRQPLVEQVASGKIDADPDRSPALRSKGGEKVNTVGNHRGAELRATTLLFDDWYEVVRHHHRAIRLRPPGQQFNAGHLPGTELDDWLTPGDNLAFLKGDPEAASEPSAGIGGRTFFVGHPNRSIFAEPFGLAQRGGRFAEQHRGRSLHDRQARTTDTDAVFDFDTTKFGREPERDVEEPREVGSLSADGDKLVATESSDRPVEREGRAKVRSDHPQRLVAELIAVGVVELLEVVEVGEDTVDDDTGSGGRE